jgi:carbon monoxide dehydrogenase subunit G
MVSKILLVIAVALAGVVGAALAYATTRPDTFRVTRQARIDAPPAKVLALITDFHRWDAWSPWEKLDPTMTRSFSGPASGVGAAYAWESTGKAGQGRMEILEATPSKVVIKLDFAKPFEAHNIAEFTLVPEGDSTDVTWSMHGPSPFIAKVMGLLFSMDQMVGKDFEAGLANMKTAAAG